MHPLLLKSLNVLHNAQTKICKSVGIAATSHKLTANLHTISGDQIRPGLIRGVDHVIDPRLNKDLAFTLEERQCLGVHGLLPAAQRSQDEQLELARLTVTSYTNDLHKYMYLNELHDRNEVLFFRLLAENADILMPIVYTPTVGLACQKFGLLFGRPRGLFITIKDRGHVLDVLRNWPETDVRAICVTDGERILGLGDLGACGMGIPVGKLALYTALGAVKPHQCLPITLDVGTNNEEFLEDPFYIGLRQKRITGSEYDDFIDEFMEACVERYGQHVLIQFEDFANHNAFRFLDKYRNRYCTFNDDIQGTASVAVAGLLAAARVTRKKISEQTFLFFGAGEASCGIANLCVKAMELEGKHTMEGREQIFMMDIDGLLSTQRKEGDLEGPKSFFAKDLPPTKKLLDVVKLVKPSALIGAAGAGPQFTAEILQTMASFNDRPIIFALSNPTIKAECTAEQAYQHTQGRCVFASGSPFGKVIYEGKEFQPGQGNNAYVFPGIGLGTIAAGMYHIREECFIKAAQVVANRVQDSDYKVGRMYPPLSDIRNCSFDIAVEMVKYAYQEGFATVYPEPDDKEELVKKVMYHFKHEPTLAPTFPWSMSPQRPLKSVRVVNVPDRNKKNRLS